MRFNTIVNCRRGTFVVNRLDSHLGKLLIEYGEFSEGEVELFSSIVGPSDIVLDVGANIGAHTVPLSRMARMVLAFEPQPFLFHALCGNLAINSIMNVQPHHMALGNQQGTISVPILDPRIPNNFGGLDIRRPSPVKMQVPLGMIDAFDLPTCRLMKIDVEGMEIEVLRGAKETLRRCRPIIYVENDRDENTDELLDLLASDDRMLFAHQPPLFSPDNFFGTKHDFFPGIKSLNILAWPREQSESIPKLSVPLEMIQATK